MEKYINLEGTLYGLGVVLLVMFLARFLPIGKSDQFDPKDKGK